MAPGTFPGGGTDVVLDRRLDRRSEDRPALVMVLAPLLGLAIWAATAFLVIGWPL